MSHTFKVFFHMGLPKTASTFLQAKAFRKMPGIRYYKKHDFKRYKFLTPERGQKYFFTYEKDVDLVDELDQIKEHFPDNAYIILVFRKHYKWIVSKYKNYIRKFGYLSFSDYFSMNRNGVLNMGSFYYSDMAAEVEKRFGDRVLFLNFDDFKQSPFVFVKKIYDFIGLEDEVVIESHGVVKRSFSANQLVILWKFNNFYRYHRFITKYNVLNQIHYKYRHFLLHIVAFFARFVKVDTTNFKAELAEPKDIIEKEFSEDWERMLKKFA
jgi:hypothetical protein